MAKKKVIKKAVPKKWDGSIKDGELYKFEWFSDGMVSKMTAEDVRKYTSPRFSAGKVLGLADE